MKTLVGGLKELLLLAAAVFFFSGAWIPLLFGTPGGAPVEGRCGWTLNASQEVVQVCE